MDTVSKPSPAVLAAVDAVQASLDVVVESMMAAYAEHIPSYAGATPEIVADVRAGAQAVVLVGLAQMRGEGTPEGLETALAALGRRRAGQGVPLPDVLLAFQVGDEFCQWFAVSCIQHGRLPTEISELYIEIASRSQQLPEPA